MNTHPVTAIFPAVEVLLCLGASITYACYRDWARATYWLSAAVITGTASFWIGR